MKKKQMPWQFGFVLISVLVFMADCGGGGGGGSSNNTSGGLSSSQQQAIAEAFSFSALSSAGGTASGAPHIMPAPLLKLQPVGAVPSTAELSELLFAAANNSADSLQGGKGAASYAAGACPSSNLTPPYNCPGGGNVYYTINLNCVMPTGCCGNNPPCTQDTMSINGMGSLIYNNCKTTSSTGESVLINGTLTATLTSNATVQCGGSVVANAKVTITGMPTISVNGADVCHGDVFITANASYSTNIYASVSGTVCGHSIYETFDKGCAVTCGSGSCCALGTVCSTCSSPATCFGAAYPVDCCNSKACPSGYRCDTANNKCIL